MLQINKIKGYMIISMNSERLKKQSPNNNHKWTNGQSEFLSK